eukprot:TRINITY_DN127_c1_g9_i1.p1 TRINITY_DN127_c1_g9~~TRINITY_DN127_c1_g9_i1.p1  ORF type:complete len:284 (+),score=115.29 TRINITY_DN127_c1_g9_i1:262-1113(+)
MADEPVFDPTKKKKKKKTKTEDAPEGGADDTAAALGDLTLGKKKKKKKKALGGEDEPQITGNGEDIEIDEKDAAEVGFAFHSILNNKYKKRQKIIFEFGSSDEDNAAGEGATQTINAEPAPWAGSDRDYTYEEMLSRAFKLLSSNNPEIGSRVSRKMKPPQVLREGTKKTVLANFSDICKTLHRKPDHVVDYIMAELGTDGSIDGNLRLVIKGRFQSKHLEKVIKSYISEYVTCNGCKGPDTTLSKQNRMYFVQCDVCGASRSVGSVKAGFQALVGKRKNMKK